MAGEEVATGQSGLVVSELLRDSRVTDRVGFGVKALKVKRGSVRPSITFVAPTPPPYAGPEVAAAILLDSPLVDEFAIHHIRSNLKSTNAQKGAFSLRALGRQTLVYAQIVRSRMLGSRGLYVLLAVNVLGFLKDAGSIWLGRLLGMRIVVHMKGANLPAFYSKSPSCLRWFVRITVRNIDVMIVQATSIRSEIIGTFDIDPSRVSIIPNMVPIDTRPAERSGSIVRLLFIGHLAVSKGFVDLLQAMAEIVLEHENCVLRCAGEPILPEGDYAARLKGIDSADNASELILAAVAGDLPFVEYLGIVSGEDKERLFRESDVLILPSYSESFPMAVLEAMGHGCAIVATSVGALPEMIENGYEGILVSPGDRSGLADAIRRLLSDGGMRKRLGSAARAKVAAAYTIDRVAPLYGEAFRRVIGQPIVHASGRPPDS
jgi:glycosyltransferase involved in cell wall biosynthesis